MNKLPVPPAGAEESGRILLGLSDSAVSWGRVSEGCRRGSDRSDPGSGV